MKPIPPIIPIPSVLILISRKTSSRAGFWATWNRRLVDWKKVLAPKLSPHSSRTRKSGAQGYFNHASHVALSRSKNSGFDEEPFSFARAVGWAHSG